MCGIAGVHRLTDRPFPQLDEFSSKLLDGIEHRGYDATGYVAVDDAAGVQLQKASCRAYYFNLNRARINPHARTVLLHTRWATQGKPAFPENNHPVEAGGIYCTHNGHISNDGKIFQKSGKTRAGQVDSEAIPALVASRGWDSLPGCLEEIEGGFAISLIYPKSPNQLVLAKGPDYPLVYLKTENLLVWASEIWAITQAWKECLGTPPGHARFHYMTTGEALLVDGREMRTVRFEAKERPVYIYSSSEVKAATKALESWSVSTKQERAKENDTVSLPNLMMADELEEGYDLLRCEDCNDWFESSEIRTVHTYGFSSELCVACADWAQEIAKVT